MADSFECPNCATRYPWKEALAGKKAQCRKCGQTFRVPEALDPAPPANGHMADLLDEAMAESSEAATHETTSDYEPTYDEVHDPPRYHTLLDGTVASNPGRLKIDYRHYFRCYPVTPATYAVGAAAALITALVVGLSGGAPVAAGIAVVGLLFLYLEWRFWMEAKERFLAGCVCPAVVVSESPYLVAVGTDLSTGEGSYPAIKVVGQPLERMTGGPPRMAARLAAVCLYYGDPSGPKWNNVDPQIVHCATTNASEIERIMASIAQEEWHDLERGLSRIEGRPKRGRLYRF